MYAQATEGIDVIDAIHSDCETNYGIWYVKKGRKKSILKLQESGPGGWAEVKRGLDEKKVIQFTPKFAMPLMMREILIYK